MARRTTLAPEEYYSIAIHAAIGNVVAKRGLPDYVTYNDLYQFVIGKFEAIKAAKAAYEGIATENFFADFLLEIETMLDRAYYGVKYNASLSRRRNTETASLRLTDAQQALFEQYQYLVQQTINRSVDIRYLDAIIDSDDLYNDGLIALARAVQTSEGGNFRAYAITQIRRALFNTIAELNKVSNPAHGTRVSLEGMLEDSEESSAISTPCTLIAPSAEDGYEQRASFLLETLEKEAGKCAPESCVYKGIKVLEEVVVLGRGWTELGREMGVEPGLLSAWVNKARQYLIKSDSFREAMGYPPYIPVMKPAAAHS